MPDTDEIIYFDAVLTPNRSLSERGFAVVMGIVGLVSFVTGMAFLSMGAVPVIGFFGLDALAIWLAFRWSFRKQSERTFIRITASHLDMLHRKANGEEKRVSVPAGFARVELEEPLRPDSWLRIEHGRTAWIIGRFLTVPERKSLAEALKSALYRAKLERHTS
jgi:uncharacterized membrane protein